MSANSLIGFIPDVQLWRSRSISRRNLITLQFVLMPITERVGLLQVDVAIPEWADGAVDRLAAVRCLAGHSLEMLAQAAILQRRADAIVDSLLGLLALAGFLLRRLRPFGHFVVGGWGAFVHHAHGVTSLAFRIEIRL